MRRFARVPQHFRNGIVVATTFGNVGDMVMAMVLGVGGSEPFAPGDITQGLAYTMVYTIAFSVVQFTLGDAMIMREMKQNSEYKRLEEDLEGDMELEPHATISIPTSNGHGVAPKTATSLNPTSGNAEDKDTNEVRDGTDDEEDVPGAPAVIEVEVESDGEGEQHLTSGDSQPLRERERITKLHKFSSVGALIKTEPTQSTLGGVDGKRPTYLRRLLGKCGLDRVVLPHWLQATLSVTWTLTTPPNMAILVSISVALIAPLREAFYLPDGSAPLHFVYDTLQMVGAATVPLGVTNLGGALAKSDPRKSKVPLRIVALIVLVRLVIMPIVGISVIYAMTFVAGVIPPENKMLVFVLMVECCVPTAQFLVSLYQIHGGDGTEVAGTMLVQYLLTIFTMSGYVSLILLLLEQQ